MKPLGSGPSLRIAPLAITIAAHAAVVVLAGYGMGGAVRTRLEPVSEVVYVHLASRALPTPLPVQAPPLARKETPGSRLRPGASPKPSDEAVQPAPITLPIAGERPQPAPSPVVLDPAPPSRTAESVSVAAVAMSASDSRGLADREPAYLSTPKPEYPEDARAEEEEGLVLLRVLVSARGVAEQVLVTRSSGSRSLDRAAVTGVRRWTFVPARRDQRESDAWMEVPVRFVLR